MRTPITYREPTRTMSRWISDIPITTLLIVIAAIAAAFGLPLMESSPPTAAPPIPILRSEQGGVFGAADGAIPDGTMTLDDEILGVSNLAPPLLAMLGESDGAIPDGTTVFEDKISGIANLDPVLLGVLRQAAADAAYDGVTFFVESGWRSPEYQNRLLREAISTYGSEAEASRWVATAETSAHVSGDAVDIGPYDAMAWLSEYGTAYGLCQIYSNEPWHFELRSDASEYGCPPMYADPTQDPRMQQ